MEFTELEKNLKKIASEANGNVSICVSTEDDDIKINETEQMKAASIIKVPMVMAGLHKHDRGDLDLNRKVSASDTVGGCGVLHYFTGRESLSLLNVMKLAIIVSDNTASNIVIDTVGLEEINAYMKELGAKGTTLARRFMDLKVVGKGYENVTTASDMILFLKTIHQETEYLSPESRSILYNTLGQQQLNHKLPFYQSAFPNHDIVIAHKTGEITGVEHDVGVFTYEGKTVYAAVLTSGWKHNFKGQQTIAQIGKKIMEYIVS